ncbi:MAG TPA: hypothetical protein VK709_13985 [Candidatus Saccharimonadales bacterium]|nr:hypothetical protein [Candidatus Saccharimonadales bacterium]
MSVPLLLDAAPAPELLEFVAAQPANNRHSDELETIARTPDETRFQYFPKVEFEVCRILPIDLVA